MNVWPFSDIHLERGQRFLAEPPPGTDVAVVAGDLANPLFQGVQWLHANLWRRHRIPTVYIPGNHEWWSGREYILPEKEAAKALAFTKRHEGIHLLMRDSVEIGDVVFLGCTLWTDYRLHGNQHLAMRIAEDGMSDHSRILGPCGTKPFSPGDALANHQQDRAWLERNLAKFAGRKVVVVTHHLPHARSTLPRYRGAPINPAFASDLSDLLSGGARLWVHGHTHGSCDYVEGGTRVVCNPRGYPSQNSDHPFENRDFDPALVIEV